MRRLAAYDLYSPDAAASAHLSRLVFLQDTIEGRRVLYINPPCNDAVLFLLDAGATNVTVVTDDNAALLSLAQACNQHERADVVRGLVASVPELASRLAGQHIFDVIFDADMPIRIAQQASRDDAAVQILALRSLLSPEGFVISALPTGVLGLEQAFHDEAIAAPVSYQVLADVLTQTFPAVEVYWQSLVLGYAFGGATQNDQQDGLSPNSALLQDGAEPAGFYVFAFGNVAPVAEDVSFIQLSGADLWTTLRKVWQGKLQRALAGQQDAEQYRVQYEQTRIDLEKVASQFNRLVHERESWQDKLDEMQHALVSERSAKSALAGRLAAMESSLVEQDQTQELQAALDEARHLLQQHQMRTKNALAKVAEQGQALSQTNEVVEQLKAQCMMLQQALQHANDERARSEHAHRALQIAIHNQADELDLALRNEETEHRQQIEQLIDGHRQELERLQREHQQQLDELRQQLNARDVRLEDTAQGALLAEQEEHAVELQRERVLVEQLVHAAKLAQTELDSQHHEITALRAQLHTAQAAQTHVSSLLTGMTALQIEQERLQNLVAAYEQQYEQQVAAKNAEQSLVGEITQSLQGMAALLQGRFEQHAHELQQAQQETAALRAHVSSLVAGMSAQNADNVRLQNLVAAYEQQHEQQIAAQNAEQSLVGEITQSLQGMAALLQGRFEQHAHELLQSQQETAALRTHISSMAAGMAAQNADILRLQNLVDGYEQQLAAQTEEHTLVGEITQSLQGMAALLQGRFAQHAHELQQSQQETAAARAHISSLVAGLSAQSNDNARLHDIVAAYEQQLAAHTEEHNLVGEITQSLQGMAALLQGRFEQHTRELQLSQQETAALRAHISSLVTGMTAIQSQSNEWQRRAYTLQIENDMLQSNRGAELALMREVGDAASIIQVELNRREQALSASRGQISSMAAGMSALTSQIWQSRREEWMRWNNIVADAQVTVSESQSRAELLEGNCILLEQELEQAKQEATQLQAHVSTLLTEKTSLTQALQQVTSQAEQQTARADLFAAQLDEAQQQHAQHIEKLHAEHAAQAAPVVAPPEQAAVSATESVSAVDTGATVRYTVEQVEAMRQEMRREMHRELQAADPLANEMPAPSAPLPSPEVQQKQFAELDDAVLSMAALVTV